MRGIFQYRDGGNYKFDFEAEVPDGMKVDDETTYEVFGYTEDTFFGVGNVVPYKHDDEIDHNIVYLVEILN